MDYLQLDLFGIADRNEIAAKYANNSKRVDELTIGDVIHVKSGNGLEFEGIYTGFHGFWDNRPEDRKSDWILATRCWRKDESWETRDYKQVHLIDPALDEWYYVGRDESYRVPDKADILPRLTERLRQLPFSQRLEAFRQFEQEYPYLSYTFNDGMNLFSDAWDQAIAEVSTIDELLEGHKGWLCKSTFPKAVKTYIRDTIFKLAPEERVDQLWRLRWSEYGWKQDGRDNWWVIRLQDRSWSCYAGLIQKMIVEARTPDELVMLAEMCSPDRNCTQVKPKAFWIQETEAKKQSKVGA